MSKHNRWVHSFLVGTLGLLGWTAAPAAAQERVPPSPNSVYVELLGNGLLYSINYDRYMTPHLTGRAGLFVLAASDSDGDGGGAVIATPLLVNYLFGTGSHHLETGVGVTLAAGAIEDLEDEVDDSFSGAMGTATLGYRYQRPTGGFVFRAGVTPFFGAGGVVPWFGISLGYAF